VEGEWPGETVAVRVRQTAGKFENAEISVAHCTVKNCAPLVEYKKVSKWHVEKVTVELPPVR
jgi:hypothetical protein